MNKLDMAHDWAMKHGKSETIWDREKTVEYSWEYADAMQAEADKRKPKGIPEALQQTFVDGVEQPRYAPPTDEWQPDWSVAPEWANWWAMDGFSKKANWYEDEPRLIDSALEWDIVVSCADSYTIAPSFNYQGDWEDSLRKRPDL